MKTNLVRTFLILAVTGTSQLWLTSCSKEAFARIGEPPRKNKELSEDDWAPEKASMARHIANIHAFSIGPEPDACLRVTREGDQIVAAFRPDVLEKLGNEKALFVFGWKTNSEVCSRRDYLFMLEGLHAMLAMSAADWRGDS